MHELSLAGSAVELIEATARREGFSRVRVVWMEIGALSCVEPDALRLAFEAAARGSCAEHARLELIDVPGVGHCPACDRPSPMTEIYALCPHCGDRPLRVLRGTEMRLKNLDVE